MNSRIVSCNVWIFWWKAESFSIIRCALRCSLWPAQLHLVSWNVLLQDGWRSNYLRLYRVHMYVHWHYKCEEIFYESYMAFLGESKNFLRRNFGFIVSSFSIGLAVSTGQITSSDSTNTLFSNFWPSDCTVPSQNKMDKVRGV